MAMDKKTGRAMQGAASGAAAGTAIMPGWGTAIGAVAGGLMGMLGPDDGDAAREKALEILSQVSDPQFDPQDLTPEQIKFIGNFMPELYKIIDIPEAKLANDSGTANDAELEALNKLGELSKSKGLNLNERLQLQQSQDQVNRQAQGNLGAIQDSYRSRGIGGGAMEMAQALNSQRNANNVSSKNALETAANAEQRALSALSNYGNMASKVRGQNVQSNQYNTGVQNQFSLDKWRNSQNIANQNTETINNANLRNLDTRQNIETANVGINNMGKQWRTQAAKDKANFAMQKAAAAAGVSVGQGAANDAAAEGWGNTMNGIMDTAVAGKRYYDTQQLNKKKKKNDLGNGFVIENLEDEEY